MLYTQKEKCRHISFSIFGNNIIINFSMFFESFIESSRYSTASSDITVFFPFVFLFLSIKILFHQLKIILMSSSSISLFISSFVSPIFSIASSKFFFGLKQFELFGIEFYMIYMKIFEQIVYCIMCLIVSLNSVI